MTDSVWHFLEDGEEKGPITPVELEKMIQEGRLTGERLVWTTGQTARKPLYKVEIFEQALRETAHEGAAAPPRPNRSRKQSGNWYDNPLIEIAALLLIWPLGVYGLAKNSWNWILKAALILLSLPIPVIGVLFVVFLATADWSELEGRQVAQQDRSRASDVEYVRSLCNQLSELPPKPSAEELDRILGGTFDAEAVERVGITEEDGTLWCDDLPVLLSRHRFLWATTEARRLIADSEALDKTEPGHVEEVLGVLGARAYYSWDREAATKLSNALSVALSASQWEARQKQQERLAEPLESSLAHFVRRYPNGVNSKTVETKANCRVPESPGERPSCRVILTYEVQMGWSGPSLRTVLLQIRTIGSKVSGDDDFGLVDSLFIALSYPATDTYGNSTRMEIAKLTLRRDFTKRTNWGYFTGNDARFLVLLSRSADLWLYSGLEAQAEKLIKRELG